MKKGFTLMELLAVIVVLSIILIIAVPLVFDVIKDSKVKAFEINAKMVLQSLKLDAFTLDPASASEITKEYLASKLQINVDNFESVRMAELNNNIALEIIGSNLWSGYVAYGFFSKISVVKIEDYDGNFIPPFTISFEPNSNSIYSNNMGVNVLIDSENELDEASLKYIWVVEGDTPEIGDFQTSFIKGQTLILPANVSGSRYLCIYAKDMEENEIVDCSDKFLVDTEKPLITLTGSQKVTLSVNDAYTDLGATAFDSLSGDLTSSIVVTNNVDTTIAGSYKVLYNVKDAAGNNADEVSRDICVLPANFTIDISTVGTHNIVIPCDAEYIVDIRSEEGGSGGRKGALAGGTFTPGTTPLGNRIIGSILLNSSDTLSVTIGAIGATGGTGSIDGGGGGGGGGSGSTALRVNSNLVVSVKGGNGAVGSRSQYSGGGGIGGNGGSPDGEKGKTPVYGSNGGGGGNGGGINFTAPSFTQIGSTVIAAEGRIIITLKP